MVGSGQKFRSGCSASFPQTSTHTIHRCQQRGMGSISRGEILSGPVVSEGIKNAYQLPGDVGHFIGFRSLQGHSSEQASVGPFRQYNCSVSCQETRGNPVPQVVCHDHGTVGEVSCSGHLASCCLHSGQQKCSSGPTFQVRPNYSVGMVPEHSRVQADSTKVSRDRSRSICDKVNDSTAQICVSMPGRPSMGRGCSVDAVARSVGVCISSDQSGSTGSGAGGKLQELPVDSSGPVMAQTTVVSNTSITTSGSSDPHPSQPQIAESTGGTEVSLESGSTQSSRLVSVQSYLVERGFSEEVAARAGKPQRQSSLELYQSRWSKFARWCDSRNRSPHSADVPLIADFLLYLFKEEKCQISTIAGYRTAIAQTLPFVNGTQVGADPTLSRLIKNFKVSVPPRVVRVPDWDLNVVLDALMKAPFEPPKWDTPERKKLTTFKTVFLVALATGARRSEIHALSRHSRDLVFSKKGVSVRTKPQFLAKNQLPDHDPGPFFIKSLEVFTGRDTPDRLLCPVRMLKYYMDFTSKSDPSGPLFLKFNGNGLPKAQTISAL